MAFNLQTAIVRHILPKANQIVDTAQQDFKSIYPFQLKKTKHTHNLKQLNSSQRILYNKDNYVNTFKPKKKTVKQHFPLKNIVYDKFNNNFDEQIFNINIFSVQKLKNLKSNDFIIKKEQVPEFNPESENSELVFDSRYQCGNLSLVSKIEDQYFLLLHNDVNTSGYTNWFYFSVTPRILGKFKFSILNYGKAGWPFGLGTGVCCKINNQWKRSGQNIFCQPNSKIFAQNDPYKNFNTLSFQFQFTSYQKIDFSYNIPYSYTDLLTTLDEIQRQKYPYYHRKLAGTTLCGNRIQMLTIGNFQKHKSSTAQQIPAIVILARSHAGQTISSWVLHFFLKFLLSDNIQAKILRDKFVFKIFPMINPDGVIHGNYRCSLIGRDLNRRWNKPIKQLYPQVYYIKNQILQLSQKKQIKLVIDLHGHSQKKNAFFYGCNDKNQPHKCRLFPYLLSKISQNYDFGSSNYNMDRSKLSTARITLFMLLKNCDVFTLQTSQFGIRNCLFDQLIFRQIGQSLVKGIYFYFKLHKLVSQYKKNQNLKLQLKKLNKEQEQKNRQRISQKEIQLQKIQTNQVETNEENQNQSEQNIIDTDKLQQQIIQNNALLKLGNDKDDGSDSQPSVCNINFDNLAKLCNRKQLKINSEANRNQSKTIKKNGNRIVIGKKKIEDNKKSIDLLPLGKNKITPIPRRFASTSHSFRKTSEDNPDNGSSNQYSHKSQSSRGISSASISSAYAKNIKKGSTQQIVKMINFQVSFEGFNSYGSRMKRKFRSTNNQALNSILDVRLNNFINYTQPSLSLARPYSFLYKNKR